MMGWKNFTIQNILKKVRKINNSKKVPKINNLKKVRKIYHLHKVRKINTFKKLWKINIFFFKIICWVLKHFIQSKFEKLWVLKHFIHYRSILHCNNLNSNYIQANKTICNLDFKLSPCAECCMLSFGWIPGVWNLYADVSEHSVCSIFIGR